MSKFSVADPYFLEGTCETVVIVNHNDTLLCFRTFLLLTWKEMILIGLGRQILAQTLSS